MATPPEEGPGTPLPSAQRPLRIAHITGFGYMAGGAERGTKLLCDALTARGHEVLVITTDASVEGRERFADVTVGSNTDGPFFTRLAHRSWNEGARAGIARALREFLPDVVHLHTTVQFGPSVLWSFGDLPAVLTVHGPEEFLLDLLPWLVPPSEYRSEPYEPGNLRWQGWLRYGYLRLIQRRLYRPGLRRLRAVLVQSDWMVDVVRRDVKGVPVIKRFGGCPLPPPEPLGPGLEVLSVGRLGPFKGVDVLIQAMAHVVAKVPGAHLTVVGEGVAREGLVGLARRLGLSDAVTFAGWVSSGDLLPFYQAARVVVVPSTIPENLNRTALEALATGRPVVGTNLGGLLEQVANGITGYLVPPRQPAVMAAAITRILSDPELASAMAEAAPPSVQPFGMATCVDRLELLYREVASPQPAAARDPGP
ncbi:MAG: glycosyltransferase family 4 protein [Actinomycetota bacterium]